MTATRRAYPPLSRVNWRLVICAFGIAFVCLFTYKYLDFVANSKRVSPLKPLIEEATGSIAGLVLFPLLYWVATRFPLLSPNWWRYLPIHLVNLCAVSFLLTTMMAAQRNLLFPLLGLGRYDYGYMPVRYVMEFSNHFLEYWVILALLYLFYEVRFARERELQQAKLETNLAEAQLQNLRLQLEPHFLFNALNAISTAIYENPRAADEMIGRLSELLRQLLRSDRAQEVSLNREIDLLKLYTRIMEARLEERLRIAIELDPGASDALVPQLLLQPIVENAIRHGADRDTFHVNVQVSARRENGQVRIIVRDHGCGFQGTIQKGNGIGLRNTRERLARLYGTRQTLALSDASDGGAIVEVRLPFHIAGEESV